MHTIAANWREADATAMEARAQAINDWLDHTEDLVKMLEQDDKIATELRSMAGTLRGRRDDFDSAAGRLRAETMNGKKKK